MNLKSKEVDGIRVKFDSSWINGLEDAFHFSTYHTQAEFVYQLTNRSDLILEIGTGNHLLYDLLKRRGWNIQSLDIDKDKEPDICSDALEFDYAGRKFNVVLAFEVFEHIPWQTFVKILERIGSSSIERIIFSVPVAEFQLLKMEIKLPRIQTLRLRLVMPRQSIQTKTHFWELSRFPAPLDNNRRTLSKRELHEAFEKKGFRLSRLGAQGSINFFEAKKITGS